MSPRGAISQRACIPPIYIVNFQTLSYTFSDLDLDQRSRLPHPDTPPHFHLHRLRVLGYSFGRLDRWLSRSDGVGRSRRQPANGMPSSIPRVTKTATMQTKIAMLPATLFTTVPLTFNLCENLRTEPSFLPEYPKPRSSLTVAGGRSFCSSSANVNANAKSASCCSCAACTSRSVIV
jgi:hypothetical protein